ncbi:4Fe-4S binding protein [Fervidicoccus fontis]|uniref:2-oxoacid:ferredoxin oxidoreductase, delta subunit n=2 Tax=Fervidicoccus fontis TaxID=683846 RepID=I0A011_FERFK|nr:4Fe-4S binding protein [Fervidicoccus fontis]AFH42318.1 2-oxoacid:ferredoxin oxidoreductase, delta subunit [Fervidicoccus fontis Kam940]MBE9391768.1 4Fe-4S binding protein [Fervidicoccus fontis]PMB75523.1 MAG: 3-methyl-2-oxobutanoate dehydrogenase subunit delta [Fervidicoccus fontis]HEW64498.1 4Fe-4S dicluster domain-containing protein [Fervidicoccus fontis]
MSNLKIIPSKSKLPISYPKEGAAGKTGEWRTERPIVDIKKCTRCMLCETYCPVNAIRVEKDTGATINYEYCKGCGICMNVCPVKAITMVPEQSSEVLK